MPEALKPSLKRRVWAALLDFACRQNDAAMLVQSYKQLLLCDSRGFKNELRRIAVNAKVEALLKTKLKDSDKRLLEQFT